MANGPHRDLINQYGGAFSIIAGHIDFSNPQDCELDHRYTYMTCFREPVERTLSWLLFVSNNFSDDNSPGMLATKESVARFINSEGDDFDPGIAYAIENYYVKHFSSIVYEKINKDSTVLCAPPTSILKYEVAKAMLTKEQRILDISQQFNISLRDIMNWTRQLRRHLESIFGETHEDFSCCEIDYAFNVIKQYDVCGLYDEMPKFVEQVSLLLNIDNPPKLRIVNETKNKPASQDISEKLRQAVIKLNKADISLYQKIREWIS